MGSGAPAEGSISLPQVIDQLRKKASSGRPIYFKEPSGALALSHLQSRLEKDFGETLPKEYVELLQATNGIQIDNTVFHSVEEFIAINMGTPRPPWTDRFLSLGSDGNVSVFMYDRVNKNFCISNFFNALEVDQSFDRLEDLLLVIPT